MRVRYRKRHFEKFEISAISTAKVPTKSRLSRETFGTTYITSSEPGETHAVLTRTVMQSDDDRQERIEEYSEMIRGLKVRIKKDVALVTQLEKEIQRLEIDFGK